MTCYGVDTARIERMSKALAKSDTDLLNLGPDQFATQARARRKEFNDLVALYLDAAECFFEVMRAVAAKSLSLERVSPSAARQAQRRLDRRYLEGFLPIYDRACQRSFHHLRDVLKERFVKGYEDQAAFVAQLVASETVAEFSHFTTAVRTAESPEEAQEHGKSGKEIVDSVKDFLKSQLNQFAKDKSVTRRYVKKMLHVEITKGGIEQSLHVINEVLGMVFHGPAKS